MIKGVERSAYRKAWGQANPEKIQAYNRTYYRQLRAEVVAAYGGECACCGETEPAFLCIDHVVSGDGSRDRRDLGGIKAMFRRIRDEGFPPGYQVLCANCNMAKESEGGCPHRSERR